ncbi:hypothetical protein [Psychrobacter sp.]|uniref:hypothetical protein n=1 Tax=Psychrobacter sp. TaxID=56811 RepID=UPI002649F56E|nr:hypothetical protein [Psychrobacter sp.]MDN6275108.1 hypothetical protein [Psychrobacter sp.]MDN6307331.1 hypothetical protein [Psychrobacter sp.]
MGMAAGIGYFIIFYTLLDDFARKKQWHRFIAALQKGIYIKAGLQVVNLAMPIARFVSPEILAGMAAVYIAERLGLDYHQPFLSSFVMTLVTGAILSLGVGVISFIILLVSSRKANAVTTNDRL